MSKNYNDYLEENINRRNYINEILLGIRYKLVDTSVHKFFYKDFLKVLERIENTPIIIEELNEEISDFLNPTTDEGIKANREWVHMMSKNFIKDMSITCCFSVDLGMVRKYKIKNILTI